MRTLIVGATGLVGRALYRELSARKDSSAVGTSRAPSSPELERLDVLESGAFSRLFDRVRPEIVFFPAAQPHVDACEKEPGISRRLNVDAALESARRTLSGGALFVFFSTDYVFDGACGAACRYREEDEPRPLNEYGRQKLAVERGLAQLSGRWLALRVCAVFGWELRPRNFVLQALAALREGRVLRCAEDQVYTPTYAPALAAAAADLAERGARGLLHLAGPQALSRAEFARTVAEVFDLDAGRVVAVPFARLRSCGAAPRPARSALDSGRAEALLGRRLPEAREALRLMRTEEECAPRPARGRKG